MQLIDDFLFFVFCFLFFVCLNSHCFFKRTSPGHKDGVGLQLILASGLQGFCDYFVLPNPRVGVY